MSENPNVTLYLSVPDMCCPVEAGQIEKALNELECVTQVSCDTLSRIVTVHTVPETDPAMVLGTLTNIGLPGTQIAAPGSRHAVIRVPAMKDDDSVAAVLEVLAMDATVDTQAHTLEVTAPARQLHVLVTRLNDAGWDAELLESKKDAKPDVELPYVRLGAGLVLAAAAETLELMGTLPEWAVIVCALGAICLAGFGTIIKGFNSLRRLHFDMETLMAVAVIGACILGAWPEAAMVMVLYEIGESIEDLSMARAKNAVSSLLDIAPKVARVRRNNEWVSVDVDAIAPGEVYITEPGGRAALDGVVVEGSGSMDESMITGESLPVEKLPGSTVYAGSLTLDSSLTIRATAAAEDSMSARIIAAISGAEQKKAPIQRFVDRFAARYTPSVFVLAIAVGVIGSIVQPSEIHTWIYRALTLLVIACPCALVISTPVTIVSALALAAKRGIIVKGGVYLEEGRNLRVIALDKTGTITYGEPSLANVTVTSYTDEKTALSLAASLASMSSHPVSRALAKAAKERGIETKSVTEFKALPGAGTCGRVEKSMMTLSNLRYLEEKGTVADSVKKAFEAATSLGQSAVALSDMFGVVAVFAVADTIRPEAAAGIAALKRTGLMPCLLTGDNKQAAAAVAATVGIEDVRAELLPEDKLSVVDEIDAKTPCGMAGDGINDAPALSRSRIGFAMGIRGSDSAIEAADVALMKDDIGAIAWFKRLSELTHRTLVQNIVFALTVKFGFAIAAILGFASMWAAVFADTGVCLIVVAWGLRLMKAGKSVDNAVG